MTQSQALKDKLIALLKTSSSFHTLSKAEQKQMQKKILDLPEDRIISIIAVLEDEKIKSEALENERKAYEEELTELLPALKQSSIHLQKAFIALQEKEDNQSIDQQSQALLDELEKV